MEAGLRVCFLPPQMHVKLITFSLFEWTDRPRRIESIDTPWLKSAHGQIDPHLHERRSRQKTQFRNDYSHPGKDEITVVIFKNKTHLLSKTNAVKIHKNTHKRKCLPIGLIA
jgi:hypothetical protein